MMLMQNFVHHRKKRDRINMLLCDNNELWYVIDTICYQ